MEGTVLNHLRIESAVNRVVDFLDHEAVEGRADRGDRPTWVEGETELLGREGTSKYQKGERADFRKASTRQDRLQSEGTGEWAIAI